MSTDKISNNFSINLNMFQNITQTDEKNAIISVFNEVDNKENDENKEKGIIKGNAVKDFLSKLKDKFGEKFNDFVTKFGLEDIVYTKAGGSRSKGQFSVELYNGLDGAFYAKTNNGKYIRLKSTSKEDAQGEMGYILSDLIKEAEEAQKMKEEKAPKQYTYKGIEVNVQEILYKMDGTPVEEGLYNYHVSIGSSFYATTNKKEIEEFIDKKLEQLKEWER